MQERLSPLSRALRPKVVSRVVAAVLCYSTSSIVVAADDSLWDIPLEELGQIRVVSIASGTETPLDKAAAMVIPPFLTGFKSRP
jgi:iron complex outermembrane receptor protein